MITARLSALVLLASSQAIAQERIEALPPPLTAPPPLAAPCSPYATPCSPYATPCSPCATPCAPCSFMPATAPNELEIHELEESAHVQRLAGHILMAAGVLTAVTGIGLMVASTTNGTCVYSDDPHHQSQDSCNSSLGFAGAITLFLGLTAFGPGAALHDAAERDFATARMLRRGWPRPWSLAPKIDRNGAGAQLALAF